MEHSMDNPLNYSPYQVTFSEMVRNRELVNRLKELLHCNNEQILAKVVNLCNEVNTLQQAVKNYDKISQG